MLPIARFQRTVCPLCGGVASRVIATRAAGGVLIRYHWCACSGKPQTVATFVTHQVTRRVSKVQRED